MQTEYCFQNVPFKFQANIMYCMLDFVRIVVLKGSETWLCINFFLINDIFKAPAWRKTWFFSGPYCALIFFSMVKLYFPLTGSSLPLSIQAIIQVCSYSVSVASMGSRFCEQGVRLRIFQIFPATLSWKKCKFSG